MTPKSRLTMSIDEVLGIVLSKQAQRQCLSRQNARVRSIWSYLCTAQGMRGIHRCLNALTAEGKRWLRKAAIKGDKPLIERAQDFDVPPNQIKPWRNQLRKGAISVFGQARKAEPEPVIDMKTQHVRLLISTEK